MAECNPGRSFDPIGPEDGGQDLIGTRRKDLAHLRVYHVVKLRHLEGRVLRQVMLHLPGVRDRTFVFNRCTYRRMRPSLPFLLLFLPFPTTAQHCGYDFRSILAVRPHTTGDSTVIDGLRITLLDSNNVPVVHYDKPWHLFERNVEPPFCGNVRYKGPYEPSFPFARDNYVLVVPNGFRTAKMKVLVQDERDARPLNKRRDRWPLRFKQVMVPLTAFDNYPLCGVFDEQVYPPLNDRPPFHPVDIILYPR